MTPQVRRTPMTPEPLREVRTPMLADAGACRNATDLLLARLAEAPDHVAFEVRAPGAPVTGPWRPVTTAEFVARVRRLGRGLVAVGVHPGDAVAIMAATRYEWAVAEMACWFAGAVVVPVYDTSAAVQVETIVADAEVRLGLAGSEAQAVLLREALVARGRDALGVWTMDADPGHDLDDLQRRADAVGEPELERRRTRAGLDTVATIVYTSGTTAAPRGALVTHGNFVLQVRNIAAAYTEVVKPDGNTIIFLPLAHVLARGLQLVCLASGMRIAHLAEPREVVPALAVLRPTFLVVVPRVLQKVQAAAAATAARKRLGPVWSLAQATAVSWGRFAERVQDDPAARPPAWLAVRRWVFDRLFYARLRELLGGRIEYILSGAAALDAELCLFFHGIGVPVVEGYGLTETTAPLTGNLPGSIRAGTVGVPMPGLTVRISPDGEVLARGVGVFAGYRNAAADAAAFADGFFRTGDLGELDASGRLTLHGRCKDVIVTSGGKTISPAAWEGLVEQNPLVAHAVLVGEGKPYLGGLILLDPESVNAWAEREGLASFVRLSAPVDGGLVQVADSHLMAAVGRAVHAANAQVARSEQVRRFSVLIADLTEKGGMVTPTLKLKRSALMARVHDLVETLYHDPRGQR
ncbi:MAG TPA: AMP-dependent synthetase/ligase [Propionicimonas sp.]|nr:AMP-dependent synthetase/ligase [Propionicimonas sp.]HRA07281.1 AMP-dependent synthetase/ligase [Propionicimonas sp.]